MRKTFARNARDDRGAASAAAPSAPGPAAAPGTAAATGPAAASAAPGGRASRSPRRPRRHTKRFYTTVSVVAVVVVLALWQAATSLQWVSAVFLPSPQAVWAAFVDIARTGYKGATLLGHLSASMTRLFTALLFVVAVGVPLGLVMGVSRTVRAVVSPFLEFYRPLPPLAYYTLIVLWLGIGDASKVTLLFLSGFAPMLIGVVHAVRCVNPVRLNAARSLGAGRPRLFLTVILREALPDILTSLRTSVGVTYSTLIAAEMVAATSGLGWMALDASKYLRNDVVFAAVILLGVIAIVLNELIQLLVRLVTPWRNKGPRVAYAVAAALIVAALGGLTAAGSAQAAGTGTSPDEAAQAEAAGDPAEIRIGYQQLPNGELLAKGEGLLEQAFPHTKITYVQFSTGADVNAALASGSVDFGTLGTVPAATGLATGLPYKVYYLHDIIGENEALIAKPGSGITSVGDLRGKTVATPFSSTAHFSLLYALRHAGLSASDLNLLDMGATDAVAAWDRGEIDAAYLWQPAEQQLISSGGQMVTSSRQVAKDGFIAGDVGVVSEDFLATYPDAARRYIEVLDQATKEFRTGSDEVVRVMVGELGMSEEETRLIMGQVDALDAEQQREYIAQGALATTLEQTGEFLLDEKSVASMPDEQALRASLASELYE